MSFVGANQKINSTSSVGGDVTANLQAIGQMGAASARSGGGGGGSSLNPMMQFQMQERAKQADFQRDLHIEKLRFDNQKEMALFQESSRKKADQTQIAANEEAAEERRRHELIVAHTEQRVAGINAAIDEAKARRDAAVQNARNDNSAEAAEEIARYDAAIAKHEAELIVEQTANARAREGARGDLNTAIGGISRGLIEHADSVGNLEATVTAAIDSSVAGVNRSFQEDARDNPDNPDTQGSLGLLGNIFSGTIYAGGYLVSGMQLQDYLDEEGISPDEVYNSLNGTQGNQLRLLYKLQENPEFARDYALTGVTKALSDAGVIGEDESSRKMAGAFIGGTTMDFQENGKTVQRVPTLDDLQKNIPNFNEYGFGFALTRYNEGMQAMRRGGEDAQGNPVEGLADAIETSQGREGFDSMIPRAALNVANNVEDLDIPARLKRAGIDVSGQGSERFRQLATQLEQGQGDLSSESLATMIQDMESRGFGEEEIEEALEGLEFNRYDLDGNQYADPDSSKGREGIQMDELEGLFDDFSTIDEDAVELRTRDTTVRGADTVARTESQARLTRELEQQIAAITDDASPYSVEVAERTAELEGAGTLSELDLLKIEKQLRQDEGASGLSDADLDQKIKDIEAATAGTP